ncbi:cytochrome P450 [Aspergillus leporis]|uniref:Cytochrome P450 n=1 Tax=Aspergillus leporis TaxID=41062 RepID=A0A5N5X2S4_9EURO|nr:cytochrome P450 [Aspergillus leporis]
MLSHLDLLAAPAIWGNWKLTGAMALSTLALVYWISNFVYNAYFHPLAEFPGPFVARGSLLWRVLHTSRGRVHMSISKLHKKYGRIVRISPNELSFDSVEAMKAVHGHRPPTSPQALRSEFYPVTNSGFSRRCIGSEQDPERHKEMRKMLSPAFSQRALLEQESIISDIVDKFVRAIGEKAHPESNGINMIKWFEMTAFDILGDMAFGESFHSVEAGKPHYWGDNILNHIYLITVIDNLRRFWVLAKLGKLLIPSRFLLQSVNSRYARAQVEKCLESKSTRKDFVTLLAQKVRDGEVHKEEMAAHVSTFAVAGGETVATFMASTTCFLLQHPEKLERVVSEIRGAFKAYSEINATQAQRLPYLQAVISEGLRLAPPGSHGLARISPGFEVHGRYIPPGVELYTSLWTVTHREEYFSDPFKFLPERWLDPNSKDLKEASQPFLFGPWDCLGRNFAIMELNLVMTKMLWTYDMELVNTELDWFRDAKLHGMWWKPKLMVRFHERSDL